MSTNSSSKPENANETCVGPTAETAGKAASCAGCPNQASCASGELRAAAAATQATAAAVATTFSRIGRVFVVLSGKGGVGKSTFSTQLAFGLARRGHRVGLLDLDICGPSVPFLCGLAGQEVHQSSSGWSPVYVDVEVEKPAATATTTTSSSTAGKQQQSAGQAKQQKGDMDLVEMGAELGVMSIGFLMPDPDSAVIWRGPKKNGLIQQFFTSVDWGQIDYLVVDTPPGTSDEHISIVQLLKQSLGPNDGAIVVTTPQEVSMMDVRKELNFCKQTGLRVLGVVENMSKMQLPLSSMQFLKGGKDQTAAALELIRKNCPQLLEMDVAFNVFAPSSEQETGKTSTPESMAKRFGCPFLGKIPLDPKLQQACEDGAPAKALRGSAASGPLNRIIDSLITMTGDPKEKIPDTTKTEKSGSGVISASTKRT